MEISFRMASNLLPFARPMSASELLDSGFRLFRATLPRCLPWSLLAVLCGQAPRAWELARGQLTTGVLLRDWLWWSITVLGGVLNVLLFGLIVLRQAAVAYSRPATLGAQLHELLSGAPGFVFMAVFWWLPAILVGMAIGAGWWGVALAGAVPALYLAIALWFAAYLRLLEKLSPLASLRTSFQLVRGHWWRTLGVLAISVVMLLVLYALGGIAAVLVTQLFASADLTLLSVITTVVVVLVAAVYMPLLAALGHTLYADLRLRGAAAAIMA